MQPEEFRQSIDINDLILPKQGIVMIWKWRWTKDEPSKEERCDSVIQQPSKSDGEPEDSSDEAVKADERSHTIVFKCIGTNKTRDYQAVLQKARNLIASGLSVPVQLSPEPHNPYNSRAIAFTCYMDGQWQTVFVDVMFTVQCGRCDCA